MSKPETTPEIIRLLGRLAHEDHKNLVAETERLRGAIREALDADDPAETRRILTEAYQIAYA